MEEDIQLAAIRAKRLAELQQGGSIHNMSSSNMNNHAADAVALQQQQQQQQDQARSTMIARILTAEARERLSRISIVKPDRARALEEFLINAARTGQLRGSSPIGQITEKDLVSILEQISSKEAAVQESMSKIKFQRRGLLDDDDF